MTAAPYPRFDGTQACASPDVDPEWFFPSRAAEVTALVERALKVCTGTDQRPPCPFLRPCLRYALTHFTYGIWGGTTQPTRNAIRKRHSIQAISMERLDEPTSPDLEEESA